MSPVGPDWVGSLQLGLPGKHQTCEWGVDLELAGSLGDFRVMMIHFASGSKAFKLESRDLYDKEI